MMMKGNIGIISFLLMLAGLLPGTILAQHAALPSVEEPGFKKDTFNIMQYGAQSGGIVLNTKSINDAITACNAKGGGVVMVPDGVWLTGPIFLKSNVNLCIARDALVIFTRDYDQYPLVKSHWHGFTDLVRCQPFIDAADQENIAITGSGVINGNGDAWGWVRRDKLAPTQWKKLVNSGGYLSEDKKRWYPTQSSLNGSKHNPLGRLKAGQTADVFNNVKDYLRPFLLNLYHCRKILLEGVTFQNSPAWCLHPELCTDLTVRNISINNPWYRQNGDGLDVESCNRVLIENNTFNTGDDAICLKSGLGRPGRERGIPTQNVIVRNNIVYQ
jgi:polygalacturonase